jgi:hypothetical protein
MQQQFSLQQAFQVFAGFWIFSFLTTLLFAWMSNGIWKVPLNYVVDTQLSVMFSIVVFLLGLYAIIGVLLLVGRQFGLALGLIFGSVIGVTITYAPVLGFQLYAWIAHIDLADTSSMLNFFNARVQDVSAYFATAISGVSSGAEFDKWLGIGERVLQILSIGSAVIALFNSRPKAA